MLKAPGTKLLKLRHDGPISSFAFKFNLRRYTKDASGAAFKGPGHSGNFFMEFFNEVGRCR
jgi:hypothetical protein